MPASSNRNNQAYIVNASDSIVTLTRFCFFVTSQPSYIFIRCSGQVRRCVPQQAGKAVDTTSPPHFHFPQAPHCARLVYNNPPANYTAVMEGIDSHRSGCCSAATFLYNTTTLSRQFTFTASQLNTTLPCISWPRIDSAVYSHLELWRGVKRARKFLTTATYMRRQSRINCNTHMPFEWLLQRYSLQYFHSG